MPANIKFVACTYRNTFIVTEENNIYSCGFNANSECGGGVPLANVRRVLTLTQVTIPNLTTTDTITNIVCGGCHTFIVISTPNNRILTTVDNKRLFSVGKNTRGQLGTGNQSKKLVFTEVFLPEDDTSNIKQISCGYNTSFVLTESNRLYSCGNNEWKSLCLKSDARWITKFTECDDELLQGETIDSVVSGYFHTVLVTKDKRMFIAGANEHGELAIANRFAERLQKLQRLPFDEFHHDLRVYSRGMYTILVADENRMYYAGSFAQKKKTKGFEQWTMEYKESKLRKISTFLCYDNAAVCILGDWKNEIQNMFKQLSKLVGNSALSDVVIA
jgi:alpha-tubulin suppressor-like RCC1 family protein